HLVQAAAGPRGQAGVQAFCRALRHRAGYPGRRGRCPWRACAGSAAVAESMTLEREFGVPIPGHVLELARWTKTALKRLPDRGPLDWLAIFGRRAPLVLDIGCGNGRFLLGSALARPGLDHLGIDILPLVLRYATRRANQRGLTNVRFAACDGQRLLEQYAEPHTFREIHCYHPQPFYESRLAHKRLL